MSRTSRPKTKRWRAWSDTYNCSKQHAAWARTGSGLVREAQAAARGAASKASLDDQGSPSSKGEHSPSFRSNLRGNDAVAKRCSTRSESAQNRKRDHPLPSFLETSRVDGVKAPPHDGTPRSCLTACSTCCCRLCPCREPHPKPPCAPRRRRSGRPSSVASASSGPCPALLVLSW